ncbi:hypothetical protein [Actinocorallia longicatena]|uniref:Antitoxin VbhA domain-containing protein n=1 Tax=Actinocorallia longicatena TaxID=111803 RepID=A0ABP6Q843_9ACTN
MSEVEFEQSVALTELEEVRRDAAAAFRAVQDDVDARMLSGELSLEEAADRLSESGRQQVLRVDDAERAAGARVQDASGHGHGHGPGSR